MERSRGRGELLFVLASCLACAALFFAVIMPKVSANRAARRQLEQVVENTRDLLRSGQALNRKAEALEAGDPFFRTAMLRWYLELQGQPWPETTGVSIR